jgi:hypothetical protein
MTMRTDFHGMTVRQHDMFDAPGDTSDIMTDDDIRRELGETLDAVRAADEMPWPVRRMQGICTMFPELAARLPREEGVGLVAAFNVEMRRLRREAA